MGQTTNVVKLSINLSLVVDLIAAIILLHNQVICFFFCFLFFSLSILRQLTFLIKVATVMGQKAHPVCAAINLCGKKKTDT